MEYMKENPPHSYCRTLKDSTFIISDLIFLQIQKRASMKTTVTRNNWEAGTHEALITTTT